MSIIVSPIFQIKLFENSTRCVKSVQIQSLFWSVFSCIWTEFSPNTGKYGPEKTPYLDTFHVVTLYFICPTSWNSPSVVVNILISFRTILLLLNPWRIEGSLQKLQNRESMGDFLRYLNFFHSSIMTWSKTSISIQRLTTLGRIFKYFVQSAICDSE